MNRESKFGLILLCALAASAAWGQVSPQTPAKAAEPVGRLFFTPAQRTSLDVARKQRARTTLSAETVEEAAPVAQTLTYGGMVRRSDGRNTVWINSRPINDQEPVGGVNIVGRVRPDGSVTLQVPQSGRSVDLKPGQSVELLSGAIEEAYSRKPVQPEPKPTVNSASDKSAKPASPDRTRDDRERRIDEATRAIQDTSGAKPGAAPPPTETPR